MTHDREVSDEALASRYADGDLDAFEEIVRRYGGPLHLYLCGVVSPAERADALLEEVFTAFARQPVDLLDGRDVSVRLYRLARELSASAPRRTPPTARSGTSLVRVDPATRTEEQPVVDSAAVRAAVDALPEEQREILVMHEWQGLSFDKIAEILDIPLVSVKSRMRFALERLHRAIGGPADKEAPR